MLKIKELKPSRRKVEEQTRYQLYRKDLRDDFNCACGYCDDSDEFLDKSTFHIDHFAPKSKFPQLELVYENLVYSCRFCNVSKSNKWAMYDHTPSNNGTKGFIDPCKDDYEKHLYRSEKGVILPASKLGEYMIKELNLGLIRHEYLWKARQLRKRRLTLAKLLERLPRGSDRREEVLEAILRLVDEYEQYFVWACR